MARWLFAWILALLPAAAFAQAAPPANPALTATAGGIRDQSHARVLTLRRFDLAVTVRGAVAETVITAAFANPTGDVLEGEFRMQLPEGAVVTGYALDVEGGLVDGVLVDRPQARAIYEAAVRQRVDPGLAEVSAAGGFTTRVYPIAPGKGRTIRLRFVAPLGTAGYLLPLGGVAPAEGWSVSLRASGTSIMPVAAWPGTLRPAADGWAGTAEGRGALGPIAIARPILPVALASRNMLGERYLQLSGDTPAAQPGQRQARVRIYWDRSRSRLSDDHARELALLRRALAALNPRTIEIVTFNSSGATRTVVATPDAAVALLRAVRYRGASSFAPLAADTTAADRCLLFSGGRPAVDRGVTVALACRLDAVTTSASADLGWLRHLAAIHGGRAFRLGADGDAVAVALAGAEPGVTAVFDDSGARLPFVPVDAGAGRWLVLARAPGSGGVRVQLGDAVIRRDAPADAPFDGEGVLLAADLLTTLGATEARADYVALSRRYGVASPSLSFLVLETPEDYVAADLAPPAGYPEERLARYRGLREEADEEEAEAKRDRLDRVAESWAEQVEWWEDDYDPRARPKDRGGQTAAVPVTAPTPAPTPSPTPAQPVDAIAAEDIGSFPDTNLAESVQRVPGVAIEREENIVVTAARTQQGGTITVDAWQPDRAYLNGFAAAPAAFDTRFAAAEKESGGVPAFYLDTAEWLHRRGRTADAVEMVLAALDLPIANDMTLGIVAARLERYGAIDRAVELRARHAALDPSRPQPRRLLALTLARRAALRPAGARADLERAAALLKEVVLTPWDDRWEGVELVALMELNALLPKLRALGGTVDLDPRLVRLLDADVRILVDWDTDGTDLDLWVDEPNGERAIYSNPRTAIGGHLSNDMTNGYGPEEYFLRRAPAGTYLIQAHVYASDALDPNGPSVITARLIRDFGRPTEREESVDIELTRDEEGEKRIGTIVVGGRR